ncbi:MAG: sulfite exporter TauE/SafE family protein [Planctomycetota bacterium]
MFGKFIEKRRENYERRVREAQQRLKPSPRDMAKARLAAKPPPPVTDADYRKRSRSALRKTILVVWGIWLALMLIDNRFYLFLTEWFMSVTMVFGSFVAGSTSAGGGAVAFPVMTLGFDISPACARNFSMAIQSVGMTAAAFAIWRCKIPVERNSLVFSTLGGAIGIVLGTFLIVPFFTNPAYTKMFFASFWLSFAAALYLVNRDRKRVIYYRIVDFKPLRAGSVLVLAGVVGGIVTSITGSGLDILTFSLLTLRYRISESVATPTSVVLMAFNSIAGFLTHLFLVPTPQDGIKYWMGDFQVEALHYLLVCIPIVVIGAPAGAKFIRNKSRQFVATMLYAALILQMAGAIWVIKPAGWLQAFSIIVFLVGTGLFIFLGITGRNRIDLKMPLFQELQKQRQA